MTHKERKPTGILSSAEELRQLVIDNPGLPLLVFAGEEANCGGDYSYMSCSHVSASVGEFLDCCQSVSDCKCYCDRDDFQEDLEDKLYQTFDGSDKEFEEYAEEILCEYDPYWKPCIIVYVDN